MIGLDSNVVLRYLVSDDDDQSKRATALIENRLSESNPGFISTVVLVEIVWVLERSYGLSHQRLATIVERLLQSDVVIVESESDVYVALAALRAGRASFSDAFIGALARRAGCSITLTFDRRAARLPEFALL